MSIDHTKREAVFEKLAGQPGEMEQLQVGTFEPRRRGNQSSGFPTKSDTNRAVQPQKMASGLKFRI